MTNDAVSPYRARRCAIFGLGAFADSVAGQTIKIKEKADRDRNGGTGSESISSSSASRRATPPRRPSAYALAAKCSKPESRPINSSKPGRHMPKKILSCGPALFNRETSAPGRHISKSIQVTRPKRWKSTRRCAPKETPSQTVKTAFRIRRLEEVERTGERTMARTCTKWKIDEAQLLHRGTCN